MFPSGCHCSCCVRDCGGLSVRLGAVVRCRIPCQASIARRRPSRLRASGLSALGTDIESTRSPVRSDTYAAGGEGARLASLAGAGGFVTGVPAPTGPRPGATGVGGGRFMPLVCPFWAGPLVPGPLVPAVAMARARAGVEMNVRAWAGGRWAPRERLRGGRGGAAAGEGRQAGRQAGREGERESKSRREKVREGEKKAGGERE